MLQIYTIFWKNIHQSIVFFVIDEKYIWLIKLLIIISSQLDSDAQQENSDN
jgi:hypothetical protein